MLVCFVLLGDVIYSAVDDEPKHSPHLRRLVDIEATGHACLLVDEYREDWPTLCRWKGSRNVTRLPQRCFDVRPVRDTDDLPAAGRRYRPVLAFALAVGDDQVGKGLAVAGLRYVVASSCH